MGLAARSERESTTEAGPIRIDELRDPRAEIGLELCCLIRGDRARLLGGVDLRGGVGDDRGDETVAVLP